MVISGFYRPTFKDIYKGATVLVVVACGAQALNYILDGSGADFMTLRYGNGNPLFPLLGGQTFAYYAVLTVAVVGTMSLILLSVIGIRKLNDIVKAKKLAKQLKN